MAEDLGAAMAGETRPATVDRRHDRLCRTRNGTGGVMSLAESVRDMAVRMAECNG